MGRGQYFDNYGYKDRTQLLNEHLNKVLSIAKKYNFKCEMWSDMFFNNTLYSSSETKTSFTNKIDKDLKLIYWDYEKRDIDIFDKNLEVHKKITNNIGVAGGAWKWLGFAPNNYYSIPALENLLKSSLKNNVSEFTLTSWGDNGGEASIFSILPTLCYASNFNFYGDKAKESHLFKTIIKIDFEKFMYIDLPNYSTNDRYTNPKNAFGWIYFYNDLLLGFYDSCVSKEQKGIYELAKEKIKDTGFTGDFKYLFDNIYNLCDVLSKKVNMGIDIRAAYKNNDYKKLSKLKDDLKLLLLSVNKFYKSFYKQWHLESKGNGFDVEDLRIGGLIKRIKTTIKLIDDYLKKRISKIDELEEEILDFYGKVTDFEKPKDLVEFSYIKVSSVNVND